MFYGLCRVLFNVWQLFNYAALDRSCFGILSGVVCACIFAVFVIYFQSNAIVVGIALNLAAWGGTTFLLDSIFHTRGVFIDARIISFKPLSIPYVSKIPYIGEIFGKQNILIYLALMLLIIAQWCMYKTPFGLRLRGVGIKPEASRTVGVNVTAYKWIATIISGIFVDLEVHISLLEVLLYSRKI